VSNDSTLSPRLETARLILRPYEERDFDALFAMASDGGMFRYSERGPMTTDEVWSRLLRHAGHWSLLGYGVFAIEDKATGLYAGEAGLGQFRRSLGEPFDGLPEATWSIVPAFQGNGLAREAAAAALRWFEGRQEGPTVCMIHHANAPSLRLAARLGYWPFRQIDYKGYQAVLFRREQGGVSAP
jgi:RimJ/RimL family protein N-acetyltransferase